VQASERRTLEEVSRDHFPIAAKHASTVLQRLSSVRPIGPNARIVDVGSAQGMFLVACAQLGYDAVGVEPDPQARQVGADLAGTYGVRVAILDGVAESLPIPSNSVDVVHAKSVVEHVDDVRAAFSEAHRVLRDGGIFWFNTASSMCPRQCEIRGFPAFGWYPDRLKRAVMDWAVAHRPHLIGHTSRPAYHWFTPRKARKMLAEAGFSTVYDRWDLRSGGEGGRVHRTLLGLARRHPALKLVGDVIVPGCSYAAVK
jgi:SAM-dependent methyltransferase